MKKIIVLLCISFILTACSAEYNLIYEDNVFKENLKITSLKNDTFVNEVNNNYNRNFFVDYKLQLGDMSEKDYISKYGGIYNKSIIDENDIYGLQLGYSYENNYQNSSIVLNLFEYIYIYDNVIKASKIRPIFDNYTNLNDIKIIFSTDKKIKDSNADEIKGNYYYWYITKDNYTNKEIKIELLNQEENLITTDGYLSGSVIKYIIMGIVIILLIFIPVIYEKVKKSNN